MLTVMYKKQYKEKLFIYGHLSSEEIYDLRREGWHLDWRDKPAHLKNRKKRNGIRSVNPN